MSDSESEQPSEGSQKKQKNVSNKTKIISKDHQNKSNRQKPQKKKSFDKYETKSVGAPLNKQGNIKRVGIDGIQISSGRSVNTQSIQLSSQAISQASQNRLQKMYQKKQDEATEAKVKLALEQQANKKLARQLEQIKQKQQIPKDKPQEQKNQKPYFSLYYKHNNIKLSNKNLTAINPHKYVDGYWSFATVQYAVLKKNSQIQFTISSIGYDVFVGLCIRNVLAANSYNLKNSKQLRHGCFIIGSGGDQFCHSTMQQNNKHTDFRFGAGNVVKVKTNEKELIFQNLSTNKEYRMAIKLTQEEWKQAFFCVELHGSGSKVSILN